MGDSNTAVEGTGFALGFVAFLIFLIGAKDAWFTGSGWLAAIAAIATVVFLILFLNKQPKAQSIASPSAAPTSTDYYDYKGDVHDVIDVEGIGPKYAERLNAAGIFSTARLVYVGADAVAAAAQVPKKTAEKWIAMCQLIKVNGIGKQYAEALVRGGIMTLEEFKRGDPDVLSGQVTSYLEGLDTTVLGQKVSPKRIQGWQAKAASMRRVRSPVPES